MSKKVSEAKPVEVETSAAVPQVNQLEELTKALGGLVSVLTDMAKRQSLEIPVTGAALPLKVKIYRAAQAKFMMNFETWFATQNVKELVAYQQSESDGNITGTIIYR